MRLGLFLERAKRVSPWIGVIYRTMHFTIALVKRAIDAYITDLNMIILSDL